ncbi:exosortase A [Thiohalocapsa sp.]|uniref:exosortase A n=1 Tax=Thiohalocapsa sp. TaxID=2497641 RepID=UPI0025DAE32A|nr:exosortase A [Thiohalocapsa sp.]
MNDMREDTSILGTEAVGTTRSWVDTWGPGVLVLLVAVSLVTVSFHHTAWSIVSIWERSETYAHGYLIIPISLWLVWEKRTGLSQLAPQPTPWPLLLFMPLGFGWLLGNLVDTLVVQQFAYVGLLVVSIWAVLGHRVTRYLLFPILFLFFGVPVGEGLVYPMMNFTADFTVGMLKLTGIPVYREGTFFTIPSGQWSVVEACSGMRYLIASVTLGVLFAYLTYTLWWKRLLFVVFSIFVPIIANGFRAYMIVMIGHLSDMKLAVGVDHLIYGWVFFGIIITIMFLVGSIWRDPAAALPQPAPSRVQPIDRRGALRLLSVMAVAALFWPVAAWALSDHGGKVAPVEVQAPRAPGWTLMPGADLWD